MGEAKRLEKLALTHPDGATGQRAQNHGDGRVHPGCGRAWRYAAGRWHAHRRVGNFWQPTVLADVPQGARILNDEPFGPVAAIQSFNMLDEAILEANRLPFGLAGYAFTRSLKNADLLARRVEVGMLWINMPAMPSAEMPFGGIKDSGYGSEGGPEALEAYLNVRLVAVMNV